MSIRLLSVNHRVTYSLSLWDFFLILNDFGSLGDFGYRFKFCEVKKKKRSRFPHFSLIRHLSYIIS